MDSLNDRSQGLNLTNGAIGTSIPLLNMHLKSSVSSPEPAVFLIFSPSNYIQVPNPSFFRVPLPHLGWRSKIHFKASHLCLLNNVQLKASRLINNPNLAKSLQPLSHRRSVKDLSILYRYFHGHCSQEIREIVPVSLRSVRTTRTSTHSHPFQFSLSNSQTPSHKSPFIPRTCSLWNVLLSPCFLESYNLPSFKSKINKPGLSLLLAFRFLLFLHCWGFV